MTGITIIIRLAMVALLFFGASAPAYSQNVAGGMGVTPPAPQTPAERLISSLTSAGITVCAPILARAGQFLFEDGDGNFTIQPLGPDVNRWPVVITIESAHPAAGTTRLTVLTIAPTGSCPGSYQQTIAWSQSCDVVKRTIFSAFGPDALLFRSVRQSELTPGIQLYLIPSGNGCISVKKELIG